MRQPVIEASDVSLSYRLARDRTKSIQEYTIRVLKRQLHYEDLWALRGVSFELMPGEVLGVIGANGAGKSTLMKVIARVLPPTHGRIVVRGHVAPLIELGAGFHPDMTGLENLILYGTLLGHDPKELREHAVEIASWAEVEEFMDAPVRSYSTGMVSRLGFAVATWVSSQVRPDLLVLDEVLSVGDERFKKRSRRKILTLLDGGASAVYVSHAMEQVRNVARTVLWLDHGRVAMIGDPGEVIDAYLADEAKEDSDPRLVEVA